MVFNVSAQSFARTEVTELSKTQNHNSSTKRQVFVGLLNEIKHYPEILNTYITEDKQYILSLQNFDPSKLDLINEKHLESRYIEFNQKYISYLEILYKLRANIQTNEQRKIATPLKEKSIIVDLELKIAAQKSSLRQTEVVIFGHSLAAHKSIERAFELFIAAPKKEKEKNVSALDKILNSSTSDSPPPNMPGTYQGSRSDRNRMSEAEKINLTPVDAVFYETQLGKKLEKDLGGKADYWSYDFKQDELYVKVGNEVGKIRVKEETSGARIIQTRVGSGFIDFPNNYGGDERVETTAADGKFLNRQGETLFGRYPSNQPEVISEDKLKGPKHEDHDHAGHQH
jgi:hypothetical protein